MIAPQVLALFIGFAFIAISIPLVRRRVKPNWLYGLRIPATFADDGVWYEANAKSGRDLLVLGAAICLAGLALAFFPGLTTERRLAVVIGLTFFGTIILAVVNIVRANRMLRERKAGRH
jgi:uncharacterized membrane protein